MNAERERIIERICQGALERPRAERDSFLSQECGGDDELRRDVERLLAQEDAASAFLEAPALAVAAQRVGSTGQALSAGQQIGAYTILSSLGAGGMGEVYRARDTTLGREVAIKVLPALFTSDPERLARFEREARLLAALNHPNIATIHGVERVDGMHALVLEVVEGETLAEAIAGRPLPVDKALAIARQMTDALMAAHDKGIVHRDLKPANIKIRPDGVVKVLDFGLAKALTRDGERQDISHSPTVAGGHTRDGVLLGTAAYMSPEQARGKAVDKRADIWAFGCVLYEMLVGERLFHRATSTETVAAVLKEEPDLTQAPREWRRILQGCLEKDPRARLRDIGDVWRLMDETPTTEPHTRRAGLAWIAGLVFLVAAAALALIDFRQQPRVGGTLRLQIPIPQEVDPRVTSFSVSPDGQRLAFFASGSDGRMRLWVRELDSLDARPLPGSESGQAPFFWSYDSRFLAFGAEGEGQLKKIDVSGGPAQSLTELSDVLVGGSWHPNGKILFGSVRGGIRLVSAAGGMPSSVTNVDAARNELSHTFPVFLPDGRRFIYMRRSTSPEHAGVYVGSLDVDPSVQSTRRLIATPFNVAYVPSASAEAGYLLFVRDGTLLAQSFDVDKLELIGEPVPLAEYITTSRGFGSFSASTNGILLYKGGQRQNYRLTWLDRRGSVLGTVGEPGSYSKIVLSPDGTRAALMVEDSTSQRGGAIWVMDLARGTSMRLSFGASAESPVWSPDSQRLAFASGGDLYQKSIAGTTSQAVLLTSREPKFPSSWSRDGRHLLYSIMDVRTRSDLRALSLTGGPSSSDGSRTAQGKSFPVLNTEFNDSPLEGQAQFSPDARWVAYLSDESGQNEVYVRAFSLDGRGGSSATSNKWLLSKGASGRIKWRADGRELTYMTSDGHMMAVDVTTGSTFSFGEPRALFTIPPGAVEMDQTSDGQRWLVAVPVELSTPTPFTVVVNWQAELRK